MKHRLFVVASVCLGIAGILFLMTRDSGDTVDIDKLVRDQTRRDMDREAQQRAAKTNLDVLAQEGRGQAVPPHLRTSLDPSGKFWVVAAPQSELSAQIPFKPGQLTSPPAQVDPLHPNPGFLGAAACQSCHEEQYATFIETAHHRTSRHATASEISGPFGGDEREMQTSSPDVSFTMIQRDNQGFQRVSFFDWQFDVPMQLVFGSSKMGESYLYWHGDQLFQAQCTYLSESNSWINSPGYLDGDAMYARPIVGGCVDCHTTYIELRHRPNRYTPDSLILGVSCERCHGPGRDHVEHHSANPGDKEGRDIIVPSDLSRQAEMDVCGQCHAANKRLNDRQPFQFRPGDRLEDHYDLLADQDVSANRVHSSNQVARLALSECFKQSDMACVECHNPHKNERGNAALFSKRCLNCHEAQHCGIATSLGQGIEENCIDCHMPRRSGGLHVDTVEGRIFPPLRDHHIRIDRQATEQFLEDRQRAGGNQDGTPPAK